MLVTHFGKKFETNTEQIIFRIIEKFEQKLRLATFSYRLHVVTQCVLCLKPALSKIHLDTQWIQSLRQENTCSLLYYHDDFSPGHVGSLFQLVNLEKAILISTEWLCGQCIAICTYCTISIEYLNIWTTNRENLADRVGSGLIWREARFGY